MIKTEAKDIDEYIKTFPEDIQMKLQELRKVIHKTAPECTETISYQMPTFDMNGKHLVYFAAFKNHIGFYPFPATIKAFKEETKEYKTSKGTIQFPLDQDLPIELIKKIIRFRLSELSKK